MKKTKTQSGITLIALIITILVLLILAGVAIKSIQDGGILTKAEQTADKYTQAQNNELADLDSYVAEIEKAQQKIGAVKDQHGNLLTAGQFIKYGQDIYAVLHNNDIEGLQIASTKLAENTDITLKGTEGYENRIQIFKQACAPYVKKELGAIDGRALGYTFNEINKLTITEESYAVGNSDDYTIVKVKEYSEDYKPEIDPSSAEVISAQKVFRTGKIAVDRDFWWSIGYTYSNTGTPPYALYYFDINSSNLNIFKLAEFDYKSGGLYDQLIDSESTKGILPVILIDQRIEITSGSGTYEDPYVYEF